MLIFEGSLVNCYKLAKTQGCFTSTYIWPNFWLFASLALKIPILSVTCTWLGIFPLCLLCSIIGKVLVVFFKFFLKGPGLILVIVTCEYQANHLDTGHDWYLNFEFQLRSETILYNLLYPPSTQILSIQDKNSWCDVPRFFAIY